MSIDPIAAAPAGPSKLAPRTSKALVEIGLIEPGRVAMRLPGADDDGRIELTPLQAFEVAATLMRYARRAGE